MPPKYFLLLNTFQEKWKRSSVLHLFLHYILLMPGLLFYSWPVSGLHHAFRGVISSLIMCVEFQQIVVNMENSHRIKGKALFA